MFRKLFGETDEEQMAYLKKRVIVTLICVVLDIVLLIFFHGILFLVLCCYYWGWSFMRAFFGIASFGAIFGRNPVIVAVILVAYLLLGYFAGIFCMFLGVGRYVYLLVKRSKAVR